MWRDNMNEPQFEAEHPEEELAAFALNALDDAEFQAVFHHVIRCPHCQEVLLGFQETAARLTEAAPEVPLPPGLKGRVLAGVVGSPDEPGAAADRSESLPAALPPADPRWSLKRLRRWVAPATIAALSIMLAASIGFMVSQHREINNLVAAHENASQQPSVAVAAVAPAGMAGNETPETVVSQQEAVSVGSVVEPGPQPAPVARASGNLNLRNGDGATIAANKATAIDTAATDAETVDHVKQEMSDVVQATVLSAQPETEKLPMTSPMGTEPEARGVLMIDPSGRQGVLMVAGMPADSYQIWLVRGDKRMMVDRIVVNENDGSGVKQLELAESVFGFHEVALMPDERHGPTNPTGEKFLSARIITGPPVPPVLYRGR